MKYLILILLWLPLLAKSQSKKETEDWILFNLKKGFASSYNVGSQKKMFESFDWYPYDYVDYSFLDTEFVIIKTHMIVKKNGVLDTLLYGGKDTIFVNMSKIIKLEYINMAENYPFGDEMAKIKFYFAPYNKGEELILPVKFSDKKWRNTYVDNFEIISYKEDVLKEGLINGLVKAFIHLAELNKSHIIKNVF